MGCAEVISLSEARASAQWQRLRHELHARFDQWLDRLEKQLPEPKTSLAEVTEAVWKLRQDLTGGLSETIVEQAHVGAQTRQYAYCPQCGRRLRARALVPGCKQLDVQKAAAQLAIELPYEEAQTLFSDLPGVQLGSERLHTFTHQAAEGLTVLDVAPSRDDIERRIEEMAAGRFRRPVLVLGIDGAYVPTRPDSARERRPGQARHRARRARWRHEWREAKGFRF